MLGNCEKILWKACEITLVLTNIILYDYLMKLQITIKIHFILPTKKLLHSDSIYFSKPIQEKTAAKLIFVC